MQLSAIEARILGALIEKEATTPDAYPLSLNALTTACNQTSNRDPVMDLDEDTVRYAVNNLRQQSLVRAVQQAGSRVMKFRHLVAEGLGLEGSARGVLSVLMLRGPQTPGELRSRTGRLAEFASVAEVDAVLEQLRAREFVVELPRRPGQKEARWAHLLSGPPAETTDGHVELPAQPSPRHDRVATLENEISELRSELAQLRSEFELLRKQFE